MVSAKCVAHSTSRATGQLCCTSSAERRRCREFCRSIHSVPIPEAFCRVAWWDSPRTGNSISRFLALSKSTLRKIPMSPFAMGTGSPGRRDRWQATHRLDPLPSDSYRAREEPPSGPSPVAAEDLLCLLAAATQTEYCIRVESPPQYSDWVLARAVKEPSTPLPPGHRAT